MTYSKRAFTLIELLVVIALIAILSVLVIQATSQAKVHARNSVVKGNIAEGGQGIEIFKNNNDDRLLIVQDTQNWQFCINKPVPNYCIPSNILYLSEDHNFSTSLFDGTADSTTFYPVLLKQIPDPTYWYSYTTEDCSSDSVASSGGYHKYSKFSTYTLLGRVINDDPNILTDYWIKDGSYGEGLDDDVPLPPLWNQAGGTTTQCQANYP